ncbi:MAG: WYL domain-containing protein [Duodenibacillus sp.]|nr:WYL domain-containing protein [Duodenibacillus sp.]
MARTTSGISQALIYLEIIKRIPRHYISTTEIRQGLEIAGIHIRELTLQRYLTDLAEAENSPIERDTRSRPYGYRLSPAAGSFPLLSPSPAESLLLKLVQEYLQFQLPSRLGKTLDPFFAAAREQLDTPLGRVSKERHWLDKVAVVSDTLPRIPPKVLPRIFEAVTNALFEEKKIAVSYRNAEQQTIKATLSPLGMVQQDGRLYLVCQFDGYDNYRHLALHRIDSVRQLKDDVPQARDFKLKDYLKSKHFNYTGDETRRIHLVLDFKNPQTKLYLSESPFNRTQTITEPEPGLFRLQVDVIDSVLLDNWIKIWGDTAQIVRVSKERKGTAPESTAGAF